MKILVSWLDNFKDALIKAPKPDAKDFCVEDYFSVLTELIKKVTNSTTSLSPMPRSKVSTALDGVTKGAFPPLTCLLCAGKGSSPLLQ